MDERALQPTMDEVQRNRTVLVIAHRLSTICAADRILVMENGRIVEEGDHEALCAHNEVYARIVATPDLLAGEDRSPRLPGGCP